MDTNINKIISKLSVEFNIAGISGILANMYYESTFRPNIYGDKGTSYGLCQWHNVRFQRLKNFAIAEGLDYSKVETQCEYLIWELKSYFPGLYKQIKNCSNDINSAYNIGYSFCVNFEKPANSKDKGVVRGNKAKAYFSEYSKLSPSEEVKPKEEVKEITYTVKKGDNLTKIANRFGTTWKELYNLNKDLIDSTAKKHGITKNQFNYIYVGQTLKIYDKKN